MAWRRTKKSSMPYVRLPPRSEGGPARPAPEQEDPLDVARFLPEEPDPGEAQDQPAPEAPRSPWLGVMGQSLTVTMSGWRWSGLAVGGMLLVVAAFGLGRLTSRPAAPQSPEQTAEEPTNTPPQPPPMEADPRVAGMWYLQVAFLDTQEAERLASFLRDNGVDARTSPERGGAAVYCNRPFERDVGAELDAYKDVLRRLGRRWERAHEGTTDLSDMWPRRYRGG